MTVDREFKRFIEKQDADRCLTTLHFTLYMILLYLWKERGCQGSFRITRAEVMRLAKIKSIASYHKILKDLIGLGYLVYRPSYNRLMGSVVILK
ncbi:hypothetical protein C8P68_108110 [Mucilaginibacter yixingensis]|uniref:Uncharacterized protein n=1 Tax=Mucilaginibacter yixingensis TaxID=1295612 RepID=A0A2T5J653_9SPHI|nr:hypothetical protein C8P68_108110 [Mucilaginibacter yixingensis]